MNVYVITVNEIEGFHHYPDAPIVVSFLRHSHRHIFHIECKFKVSHDNREIEIFMQQYKIEKYLSGIYGNPCRFGSMSCEMIAKELMNEFSDMEECKVTEDGKGGAAVQR